VTPRRQPPESAPASASAGERSWGAHDPGTEHAAARFAGVEYAAARPVSVPGGGTIRFGTASWTDPTLTRGDVFYPRGVSSAEGRLRFYAEHFAMVEVDSTYYALPARRMTELWVERTPLAFTFDVKAHALMTGQPSEVQRLPADLRAALPAGLAGKSRIYAKDLPAELADEVWRRFVDALAPLHGAGKLGAVLLQYPRWFVPSRESRAELLRARERLGDVPCTVELRNARWFAGDDGERTLRFLSEHALPYVMVDEPQGLTSSVPPVTSVTSPRLAVVRFHGRRTDRWERSDVPVAEKYRYLYDTGELAEWAARLREVAREAHEVHAVMNNCYANYGTTNAAELAGMMGGSAGRMQDAGQGGATLPPDS